MTPRRQVTGAVGDGVPKAAAVGRGSARTRRTREGPRARALTCSGNSAETVVLAAAAAVTQAEESSRLLPLSVRSLRPRTLSLIYSQRDRCACAVGSPAQARRVAPRESEGLRGKRRDPGFPGSPTGSGRG